MAQNRLRDSAAVFSACLLLACGGGTPAAEPAPVAPEPTTITPGAEPADPAATDSASEQPPADGGSGRLAFIQCETPRPTVCTKEYRPVCAEVDTGIRCIKAPCPSSEKKTYATGCTACADEKVIGYFSAACDAITSGQTP